MEQFLNIFCRSDTVIHYKLHGKHAACNQGANQEAQNQVPRDAW